MTNTATQRRIRSILGPDRDLPAYPVVTECTKFVAHAPGAYNMTAGTDDLHRALELAWEGYRMSEQPAYVWDLRGDGADYDATAEPILLAVVGVFWLDGQ